MVPPPDPSHAADATRNARMRATAWVGVVVALTAPPLTVLAHGSAVAQLAALAMGVAGTGPGILCWIDAGDGAAQAGLVVVGSLSILAVAASSLIWLHLWLPGLLWVLVLASGASCALRLWSDRAHRVGVAG